MSFFGDDLASALRGFRRVYQEIPTPVPVPRVKAKSSYPKPHVVRETILAMQRTTKPSTVPVFQDEIEKTGDSTLHHNDVVLSETHVAVSNPAVRAGGDSASTDSRDEYSNLMSKKFVGRIDDEKAVIPREWQVVCDNIAQLEAFSDVEQSDYGDLYRELLTVIFTLGSDSSAYAVALCCNLRVLGKIRRLCADEIPSAARSTGTTIRELIQTIPNASEIVVERMRLNQSAIGVVPLVMVMIPKAVSIPIGEGKTTLAGRYPQYFIDHEVLLDKKRRSVLLHSGQLDALYAYDRSVVVPPDKVLLTWGPESVPDGVKYCGAFLLCGCEKIGVHKGGVTEECGATFVRRNLLNRRALCNEPLVYGCHSFDQRDDRVLTIVRAAGG